jgi:hypothetical protein
MWLDVAAIILATAIGFFASALQFVLYWGDAPISTIAPEARDRLIRRQMIQFQYSYITLHPSQKKLNLARDRRVGRSAIGQCLKDQYDAVAIPIPSHLAALVKQLETQYVLRSS